MYADLPVLPLNGCALAPLHDLLDWHEEISSSAIAKFEAAHAVADVAAERKMVAPALEAVRKNAMAALAAADADEKRVLTALDVKGAAASERLAVATMRNHKATSRYAVLMGYAVAAKSDPPSGFGRPSSSQPSRLDKGKGKAPAVQSDSISSFQEEGSEGGEMEGEEGSGMDEDGGMSAS